MSRLPPRRHSRLRCASLEMTKSSRLLSFEYQSYRGRKIRRQRSLEIFPFLSARMTKSKLPRMQHLSRENLCEPRRIDFITEQRETEMMEMHANLMSPSAVQPAFDQSGPIARPNGAILGFGCASTEGSRAHS